jgi:hypothetical protein
MSNIVSNKVSPNEFIRRLTWLSARFPNYKIRCYTYYHDEVYDNLKKMGIPHEKYYGFYYDSYAEDIRDYGVYLNIDRSEILDFTIDIENTQSNRLYSGDNNSLKTIFNTAPPSSLVIRNTHEFIKEIVDNIFCISRS